MGLFNIFSEKKLIGFGICVATSQCALKKREKNRNPYTVYKGTLIKFVEFTESGVIFTPITKDLKLITNEYQHFEWIDEGLYKYLHAIHESAERLKFFKNDARRKFIQHLRTDTVVGIQCSPKLQIKAKFIKCIEVDKKNFVVVELLEEPSHSLNEMLKKNRRDSPKKQLVYSLPANMINNCFVDVDKKIEENLKIDKSLWRCEVCLKESLKLCKKCQYCGSQNQIENGDSYSIANINRNKSGTSRLSWNNDEFTKEAYYSNDCYGKKSDYECFDSTLIKGTNRLNGSINQSDKEINNKIRSHEVLSDVTGLNDSCILPSPEARFKQRENFADSLNIGKLSHFPCDTHINPEGLQLNETQSGHYNKQFKDFSKKSLDLKSDITDIRAEHLKFGKNGVMNVPLVKSELFKNWCCTTCFTKNDQLECIKCGEKCFDIDLVANNPNITAQTKWNCAACLHKNILENNNCYFCGESREEISGRFPTPASVDNNLLVSTTISNEIQLNPFEASDKCCPTDKNIPNPDDDFMEHHDFLVMPNIYKTKCCLCKKLLIGTGIVLCLCQHTFCETCVENQIISERKCLAVEVNKPCERRLELSEIKCLLPSDKYKEFCANIISLGDANPYIERCYNKNCSGYYLWEKYYEVRPTVFRCNECKLNNCMSCSVIHDGLTCDKYKKFISDGDLADMETIDMFLTMIREGIAMQCPKCETLIEKDQGCDWVQCPLCNTEICWATRGPRWGPKGRDDTSGGCGCTKEKLCVPSCNYCH